MKIKFLLWNFPAIGGTEKVTETWVRELCQQGHEVEVIANTTRDGSSRISAKYYSPLEHHLHHSSKDFSSISKALKSSLLILLKRFGLWKYISISASKLSSRKLVKTLLDADVLILSRPDSLTKILELSGVQLSGLKWPLVISQFHTSLVPMGKFGVFSEQVDQLLPYISGFTALSPADAEYAQERWGKPAYFLPNPLPHPEKFSISSFEDSVVICCRLVEDKGVDTAIEVFYQFIKDPRFSHWSLDIYGDGPAREKLEQLVNRLGLVHAVKFHGFVNDSSIAYSQASLHLLTSKFEGRCIAIMEAAASGIPTVGFNVSAGVEDLLKHLEGFPIPPGSQEEFLEVLKEVASDKKNIKEKSSILQRLAQVYSPEKSTDNLLEIIQNIAQRHTGTL